MDGSGSYLLAGATRQALLRDAAERVGWKAALTNQERTRLNCAVMALFGPGDEVILPSPYWVSHPEQIRLAGATPVFVETDEGSGFRLTAGEFEAAVTPRTRGVILNYPSNPTGACFDRPELEALAEVCVRHDLVVVADEIYEKLLYDGRTFTSISSLGAKIYERAVLVNGTDPEYIGFDTLTSKEGQGVSRKGGLHGLNDRKIYTVSFGKRRRWAGFGKWLYLLPALAILVGVVIYPLIAGGRRLSECDDASQARFVAPAGSARGVSRWAVESMDLAKKQIQPSAAAHRSPQAAHALYTARQMSHRDKPMSPQRHRERPVMPRIGAVPGRQRCPMTRPTQSISAA